MSYSTFKMFGVRLPDEVYTKYKLAVARKQIKPTFMQGYMRYCFMRLLENWANIRLTTAYNNNKGERIVFLTPETVDVSIIQSLLPRNELKSPAEGANNTKELPPEQKSDDLNG